MRKTKQVISMILALTMLLSIFSVGIVQTSAAADDEEAIYQDPPYDPPLLGDIDRNGRVDGNDVFALKSSIAKKAGFIRYDQISKDSVDFRVADCFVDAEIGQEKTINGNDVWLLRCYVAHKHEAEGKGIGEPIDVLPTEPAPTEAPEPTETQAPQPTEEPLKTATITIYGLNGQSETKEFNIGDTFKVYTSLNVASNSPIAALSATQTFTDSILSLNDTLTDEDMFVNTDAVFPVLGEAAMGRLYAPGNIQYNASTPNGFVFDSDDDLAIVTEYKVTTGGTGEVRNTLTMLAAADDGLTRLVNKGVVASGVDLTVNATFDKPAPEPTQAPETEAPQPTDPPAPTETEAPEPTNPPAPTETEAPEPTVAGKATVTVRGLDGETETQEFNVGDTFTVYTTLNTSNIDEGKIGSLDGRQYYTNTVLALADEYDHDEGDILDINAMFPITGNATVANGLWTTAREYVVEGKEEFKDKGAIYFNASKASIKNPFFFDDNEDILIKSNYTVTAPGEAVIFSTFNTLAVADEDLTRIVDKGQIVNPDFRLHSSFIEPALQPTSAPKPTDPPAPTETEAPQPTDPPAPTETEAPEPTDPPAPTETEAPEPTDPPAPTETEAPEPTVAGKATVTVRGLDGETETQEFNVGDTFTVYTTLNTSNIDEGKIGSLDGRQYYTNTVLALADEYDHDEGDILDINAMFPITGNATVANGLWTTAREYVVEGKEEFKDKGAIYFNASKASIKNPFFFDDNEDILIKSNYTVTAPGEAVIFTTFNTLAVADEELTRIIDKGQVMLSDFRLHSSFIEPALQPTAAPQPTETQAPQPTETQAPQPTETPVSDNTIIFSNNKGLTTVNIYYWSDDDQPVEWPGVPMTYLDTNDYGEDRYYFEMPDGMTNYIINDGTQQTVDIPFTGATGVYMTDKDSEGHYMVDFYEITDDPTPDPTTPQPTETQASQPTESPVSDNTIIFSNNKGLTTVNIYYWSDDDQPVEWPGVPMTYLDTNDYGEDRYYFEMPDGMTNYIINDGTQQTVDIPFTGATGVYMTDKDSEGHYMVDFYEITDDPTPDPTTPQPTTPNPTTPAPTTAPATNDVVFEPGEAATGSPAWFAWVYSGSAADQWIQGTTDSSGNVTFAGAGDFGGMVIVRMPTGSTSGAWSGYWNRTGDITIQSGKTLYFTGWNNDYFNTAWK